MLELLKTKIDNTSFVTIIASLLNQVDEVIELNKNPNISKYTKKKEYQSVLDAAVKPQFLADNRFSFNAFNEAEYVRMLFAARVLGFEVIPMKNEINFPTTVGFDLSYGFRENQYGKVIIANDGFPPYTQEKEIERFEDFFAAATKVCAQQGVSLPEFDLEIERFKQYL